MRSGEKDVHHAMKRKKLPAFISNPWLVDFFQSKPGRVLSNWILQGMLYMNPVEVAVKLGLDVLLTVIWWFLIGRPHFMAGWLAAWLLAHTTNWLINGQPIAMRRHMDWGRNDPRRFIDYIESLERRLQKKSYLAAAASFGSLSRGGYKETSDIDLRVVMQPGMVNRLRAAIFCLVERLRAAICRFPLDLYAFDLEELLHKMSRDEVPVIFSDPDTMLRRVYAENVNFQDFRENFRRDVLGETLS